MINKCKLFVIAMLSMMILILGGTMVPTQSVSADEPPTLQFEFLPDSGFESKVYFGTNSTAFLLIDTVSYTVSSDVTEVYFTMTDPEGEIVPNGSDVGGYYYEYNKVGTYVLTVHISNTVDSTTKTYNIECGQNLDTSRLGTQYDMDMISDSALYQRLQVLFEDYYYEQYGAVCNISGVWSDMFTIVDIDILDLSGLGINNVNGFQYLNFGNINGINLSNNGISDIKAEYFDDMYNRIKSLDLSNNRITSIALDSFTGLRKLNLSNNELTAIDLTKLNIGADTLELNLAHNNIEDTKNISIPKGDNKYGNMKINLMSNHIGVVDETMATNTRLSFVLGFQFVVTPVEDTLNDNRILIKHTDTVYYYKTGIANLNLKIYSITQDIDGADIRTLFKTIDESTMVGDKVSFTLNCGEYEYKYYLGEEEAYSNTNDRRIYRNETIFSIPNSPEYYYEHNNKTYSSLSKVTGTVKVHIKPYESQEDIKLYYSINGHEWVEGTVAEVQGGVNTVYLKAVSSNGMESFSTIVRVHTSLNPYIPDIIMLVFIIFLLVMIVFVAVPLLGKWINSDSRRK